MKDSISPSQTSHAKESDSHMHANGHSQFALGDFAVDSPTSRPLKVIIIGAGFSGIAAGIRFLQRIPHVEIVIYEQNTGIGGTWYTNRYPGLACDIPSHCYQYTFFNNPKWSAAYAPGPEILAYIEDVASTYQLSQYIKLEHEMVGAQWDEDQGKWVVRLKRPVAGSNSHKDDTEIFEDRADLLFTGIGGLSRWKWPKIEGLHEFKGTLIHTARWDANSESKDGVLQKANSTWQEDVKDWGTKSVGVIGVGSTGIQIVPALQPRVGKLYNYVRSQNWLAVPFAGGKLDELLSRDSNAGNHIFTEEEKQSFENPAYYKQFRRALESELNSVHQAIMRDSDMQKGAKAAFKANMLQKLAKKPWIADHLIPEFGVGCRRLTPGPGYLEALCEDNVEFISSHIKKVTPQGIETVDGQHQDLDVLICATGYDTSFNYPFSIIGRNGVDIRDKWLPHPRTYLAVCVDEFPNWFFSLGPNSGVGSGSLLALIEAQIEYAVMAGLKLQRERLKSIEVKKEAVDDYDEYIEHYFPTTVYSEKCPSWYKLGKKEGRVAGLWPGSCLHALIALRDPRWEDFSYERMGGQRNRLHWLGNGMTHNEQTMSGDRAWYLADDVVDIPPVPLVQNDN